MFHVKQEKSVIDLHEENLIFTLFKNNKTPLVAQEIISQITLLPY